MSRANSLQTLDLILEDISAEINLSINALEHYSRDAKTQKAVKKSLLHLNKVRGVFDLLEMPAAVRLISDAIKIVTGLPQYKAATQQRLLGALSVALVRLIRYVEHVNQKDSALAELLLPSINELRASVNAPQLDESFFFECDIARPRAEKPITLLTCDNTAEKSRHYRQMYQIGLIEVLRQTNLAGGLKMMQKALVKLDAECIRPSSPNLWWIAQGMLEGYIQQGLALTKERLKLFSRLDRQIRNVENKPVNRLDDSKQETQKIAQEMLYLVWISGAENLLVVQLMAHFQLEAPQINDQSIRDESDELRGPSDQDYNSMTEALLEEIQKIEESIRQVGDNDDAFLDLELISKQMINLNNLLKILQVDDQTVRLSVAIDLVEKTISDKTALSDKDCNILFLVMKSIKEAIDESKLAQYAGKNIQKRNKISAAKIKICQKTENLIKQLIRDFTQFNEEDRNRNFLKNIEKLLIDIQKGFQQLKVEKAVPILDGCQSFLQYSLIRNPHSTSESSIEFFADIIGSLEFYLETLMFTAEPNSRILDFAENSLSQLNNNLEQA